MAIQNAVGAVRGLRVDAADHLWITILLPRDFKEFLRLLNSSEVEYLLIGGYARNCYVLLPVFPARWRSGYGREIVLPPAENATVFAFWLTADARMGPLDGKLASSIDPVASHSFNLRAPAISARQ